jgi:hypothetical protein
LVFLLAACGTAPQSHGGPVQDVRLSGGTLAAPADVQLFEYGTAEAAATDAHQIRADGSGNPTMIIDWIAPPHFFVKGRVLAIYLGNDRAVVNLLGSLLGPQFAGA